VLDIRTKLDMYASDVLDQMYDLTTKSEDLELVAKVGFGLLDRAGYSTTQKFQQVPPAKDLASETTLSRVALALEQSASVDAHIVPAYVPKPPPDEGRGEVGSSGTPASESSPGSELGPSSGNLRLAKVSGT